MHVIEHPQTQSSLKDALTPPSSHTPTPLPLFWYIFFGIVEPLSVAAGCVYATVFQENYHSELVPASYLAKVAQTSASGTSSMWAHAFRTNTAQSTDLLGPATRMALAQLGSCYFLIMLNSALMFYAIRRWFSHSPRSQEHVLYHLFAVLGIADWTHILLTLYFLPDPTSSPPLRAFGAKLWLLATHWSVWNSLLFGNIVITLLLFLARSLWWIGVGRDTFYESPPVPAKNV